MLTQTEKTLFLLAALVSFAFAVRGFGRIRRIIRRGGSRLATENLGPRLAEMLRDTLTLRRVFRSRPQASRFHALVAWAFLFYLLINVGDTLHGFLPNFTFLGTGVVGGIYRLLGDVLSVGALVGIGGLLARRFVRKPSELEISRKALVHPKARFGIRRDSALVGTFILLHVGARFLGESFDVAGRGLDGWRPFASGVGWLWSGWGAQSLTVGQHICWWLALGLILAFVPYFPYTKHIHIFFAPLNYLLKPKRRGLGQMEPLALEADTHGAARLEDLSQSQLLDAFACVHCNRCQEVCPANMAGTALSPAALEINKRYQINGEMIPLASGQPSRKLLTDFALTEEAAWACTSCGACVDICPVGNEPMQDILAVRRHLTLNEGRIPDRGAATLRNVAVVGNPWGAAPSQRTAWAEGLNVRTLREAGRAEV